MTDDLTNLDDHELLLSGRMTIVAANHVHAARLRHLVEFYRRRAGEQRSGDPHFSLTARQATVVEVGALWGIGERPLRTMLNNALYLQARLPLVWALVLDGVLDEYRTKLVAEGARLHLYDDSLAERYDARMASWLRKHLTGVEGEPAEPEIVTCTTRQLRNRISYVQRLLRPADAEARHRKAMADRRVATREDEDGMGFLTVTNSLDKVRVAERRLTLAAKAKRAEGDTRTLDQLRADLALDLLTGLGDDIPVPSYARPVVNMTVPMQTVMGLSDAPGVLSGGTVIPAGLARAIAADPDASWYRMLTDPTGHMVELSTQSYQPTAQIIRAVVARHGTCYRPGCDKPADQCELDHLLEFPDGPTCECNLGPACKLDHTAKHSPGFGLQQQPDGSWVLLTAAGFRHPIRPYVQPTLDGFPEIPVEEGHFQFSASEIADAIARLRHEQADRWSYSQLWEEDDTHEGLPDDALHTIRQIRHELAA